MIRVFCDFDGTVAAQDVGNQLFQRFAGEDAARIVERYRDGEINAVECLTRECAAVKNLTPEALEEFVDRFSLDAYFPEFVSFCAVNTIPLTIVSDGLDIYVERLLRNNDFGHLPWFANHAEFVFENGNGKLVPSFPHRDEHCDQCGNCKRNHMITLSGDDDILVYVGDGISDRCPVRYADIVFAKKELIHYCQEQNITYHEFRHFGDVKGRLETILRRRRLKPRREALMARRDAFMAE